MKRVFLAVIALLIGVSSLIGVLLYRYGDPLGAHLITERKLPSLGYGVQTFLWWNYHTRQRDVEFVRMMRFGWVKQIFGWKDIHPDPNLPPTWADADEVVAELDYRGLQVIARLGKPPDWAVRANPVPDQPPFDEIAFGRFCGELAARYKGKIAGYQVWNEPNLDREWLNQPPNAAAYVKVVAECARAIRAADPQAVIITAGLAPTGTSSPQVIPDDVYLQQMFDAGVSAYYDVLGLNAPGYLLPPETPPSDPRIGGQRWQVFRHVEDMRAIQVARGDGHKQVAILEMGWTTDSRESVTDANGAQIANPYRWHAVSEEQQAEYLVAAYNYAAEHWRPWMSVMITIYLADPEWTPNHEEYWWALNDAGWETRLRPAYIALANAARSIDNQYLPPIAGDANPYTPMPPRPRN